MFSVFRRFLSITSFFQWRKRHGLMTDRCSGNTNDLTVNSNALCLPREDCERLCTAYEGCPAATQDLGCQYGVKRVAIELKSASIQPRILSSIHPSIHPRTSAPRFVTWGLYLSLTPARLLISSPVFLELLATYFDLLLDFFTA